MNYINTALVGVKHRIRTKEKKMASSNESSSNSNMHLKDADKPFKYVNYEGTDWGQNMGLFHGNSGGTNWDSSPQPHIQSQYMLFAKSKMNPVCKCLSASSLTGWDCFRQCLRNSNKAHLNCYTEKPVL